MRATTGDFFFFLLSLSFALTVILGKKGGGDQGQCQNYRTIISHQCKVMLNVEGDTERPPIDGVGFNLLAEEQASFKAGNSRILIEKNTFMLFFQIVAANWNSLLGNIKYANKLE